MIQHEFIFHPGRWIGEGKVSFSGSPEKLRFYTRWLIDPVQGTELFCVQEVEMQSHDQRMENKFHLSHITPTNFDIHLENALLGSASGNGVIDPRTIAWEYHGKGDIEGFEVYELQDNGDYMLHAEYTSADQFRTIIDGRIWRKE